MNYYCSVYELELERTKKKIKEGTQHRYSAADILETEEIKVFPIAILVLLVSTGTKCLYS